MEWLPLLTGEASAELAEPSAWNDDASDEAAHYSQMRPRSPAVRRFIDAVIEGRRRKAAQQLAIFLEHHKHSLRDDVRIELQRCLLDACKPGLGMGSNPKEDRKQTRIVT